VSSFRKKIIGYPAQLKYPHDKTKMDVRQDWKSALFLHFFARAQVSPNFMVPVLLLQKIFFITKDPLAKDPLAKDAMPSVIKIDKKQVYHKLQQMKPS
jgi:hypothetical protein